MSSNLRLYPVTFHAVRRWLERVEGFETPAGLSDVDAVEMLAEKGWCDPLAIRRYILTPGVFVALRRRGYACVRQERAVIACRAGIVATVLLPDAHLCELSAPWRAAA